MSCAGDGKPGWTYIAHGWVSPVLAEFFSTLQTTCNIMAMGGVRLAHLAERSASGQVEVRRQAIATYHTGKLRLNVSLETVLSESWVLYAASVPTAEVPSWVARYVLSTGRCADSLLCGGGASKAAGRI